MISNQQNFLTDKFQQPSLAKMGVDIQLIITGTLDPKKK